MAEGRKSHVVLLDDRKLEFLIQPKLYVADLLDMVASHFNLKEKEYFGLAYIDDTGHYNWLQLDKKVLDHDYPKRIGPLVIYFLVRFFIESIGFLKDSATVEVFFLQAKRNISNGIVDADSDTIFELAAHVLQATHGDYTSDETTRHDLQKLPVLPVKTLTEYPTLSYCEDQIIGHYKKLAGLSRGSALVYYMTIVESLPTYGIHYYEVKDKTGLPWWLGLSYKGVAQYDYHDKKLPRRVFSWKQLENLYFRDKKFSIEIHDAKRVSVSRRTFGPSNVSVYAWFAVTPQLTKSIWSMAVCQHQFYLDRKQSKSNMPQVRSMSEIAADLSQSIPSLSSGASDSISHGSSSQSLSASSGSKGDLSRTSNEETKQAHKEIKEALTARKKALDATLFQKIEELRQLCIREGEITGELPIETPLIPGEPIPTIRRRVGTAFTLSSKMVDQKGNTVEDEKLASLELDYELQKQIVSAAYRLSKDSKVGKKVRKSRKEEYQRAHIKLKDLEKKLSELRTRYGQAGPQSSLDNVSEGGSSLGPADSLSEQSESDILSPEPSPAISKRNNVSSKIEHSERPLQGSEREPSTGSSQCSLSDHISSQSPAKQASSSRDSSPSPSGRYNTGSYASYSPSPAYRSMVNYRNQLYPQFGQHSPSNSEYEYKINHYNVHESRISHYESTDELKSPTDSNYDTLTNNRLSRHGSIDITAGMQRSQSDTTPDHKKYGSLERNFSYSNNNYQGIDRTRIPIHHLAKDPSASGDRNKWSDNTESPRFILGPSEGTLDLSTEDVSNRSDSPGSQSSELAPIPYPYVQGHSFTTVTQYQTYREETKPYELSDFYKYSEKLRRARSSDRHGDENRRPHGSTSSQYSSSSERSFTPMYAHSVRTDSGSPAPEFAVGMQHNLYSPSSAHRAIPVQHLQSPQDDNMTSSSPPTPGPVLFPGNKLPFPASSQKTVSPFHSPRIAHKQPTYVQPMKCEPVREVPKQSSQRNIMKYQDENYENQNDEETTLDSSYADSTLEWKDTDENENATFI